MIGGTVKLEEKDYYALRAADEQAAAEAAEDAAVAKVHRDLARMYVARLGDHWISGDHWLGGK
jgi:hypothetical protein